MGWLGSAEAGCGGHGFYPFRAVGRAVFHPFRAAHRFERAVLRPLARYHERVRIDYSYHHGMSFAPACPTGECPR